MTWFRFLTITCLLIVLPATSNISAMAASTNWKDLGGGKARLHAVLDPVSRRIEGALEIELNPGWTTYWRYPGSSGIPPLFDFAQSKGLESVDLSYPAPSKMGEESRSYAGYKNRVTFPFSAAPTNEKAPEIALSILVGVCEEICIPAKATFQIKPNALMQSDPSAKRTISFAWLKVPKRKLADDFNVITKMHTEDKLEIHMRRPDGYEQPYLFVEGPSDWNLLPAKLVNTENDILVFHLDASSVPDHDDILAQPLLHTLSNGSSGIEFLR